MTEIRTSSFIKSMSGKDGEDSDVIYCTNNKTGKVYKRKYKKPTKPRTEKQKANSIAFKEMSEKVAKWLNDNGPSDAYPNGTPAYVKVRKAYDSQHTKGNLNSYVWVNFDKLPK